MTNARDKANIPVLNFQSKGIDDNADATAITIDVNENVGIGANPNHYSVLTDKMILNLLVRAGFDLDISNNLESTALDKKSGEEFTEMSYGIIAAKKRPIDVK